MERKADLRRRIRRQRRALTPRQRRSAARALRRALQACPLFRRARRVACYLPADGELDTRLLMTAAWLAGKRIFLPVVPPGAGCLRFRELRPDSLLRPNRFRIPEPYGRECRRQPVRSLDLVLTPLVAFDRFGHRLGMGGGFYDRTFAFLHRRRRWQHPKLLGVAYAFQEVDELPAQPWDVPLWGVATERGVRKFPATRSS